MKKYLVAGVLALVQVLCVLMPLVGLLVREPVMLEYDYTNLVLNSGYADSEQKLTHIDSSYAFSGYFAYTAPVSIPKGRYEITLQYNAQEEGCKMEILHAGANSFDKVMMDDISLEPEHDRVSFYVWVKEDLPAFQLASVYGGEGSFDVISMSARETRARAMWLAALLVLMFILDMMGIYVFFYKKRKLEEEACVHAFLLLAIILFASMPLLNQFLIKGSDMEFHMLRIEGIKEGLLAGQLPVRIQPVQLNGYGYPVSMFYGDLLLYFPAVLRIMGVAVQDCYKLLLIAINVATCLVMYGCARGIFRDRRIALFAAAVYTLVPYRLNSLYVRAAVGEMAAYVFLPLIVYGLYHVYMVDKFRKKKGNGVLYAVIGYTGVIESHILTCEFVVVFTILACVLLWKKTLNVKRLLRLLSVVVCTVLVNAFFLVPFFHMMGNGGVYILDKYTFTGQFIQGQGLNPASLFDLFPSGNGIIYNNALEEYGLYGMKGEQGMTIGIGLIVLMGLGVLQRRRNGRTASGFGQLCGVLGFLALWMSLNCFPWDALEHVAGRLVSNIQFPWRILCIASVMAVFGGCTYLQRRREHALMAAACVLMLTIISAGWCMHDRLAQNTACYVYDMAGLDTTMTGSGSWNEYVPTGTKVEDLTADGPVVQGQISVSDYRKQYTNVWLRVKAAQSGYVEFPLLYYEGYVARNVAGEPMEVRAGTNNVVRVLIPEGYTGEVRLSYEGLKRFAVADWVSVASVLLLGSSRFLKKRRRR